MDQAERIGWLRVDGDGDRFRVRTGKRLVSRRRAQFLAGSALCCAAGVALAFVTLWALALSALGAVGLVVTPRLVRTAELLEVDGARDRLTALQLAVGPGATVPLSKMRRVRGAYEIYGWDPRSTIYAVLDDGSEVPVLVFTGTNEPLAEEACRILGTLSGTAAVYTGPYGAPKTCFDPATLE